MTDLHNLTDPLTDRELEILSLLSDGLSNRKIANRLHLAHQTVKGYNSAIYSKLGVSNRDEAVERATELGLLDYESDTPQPTGKHNLPESVTEFVGRKNEINDLVELVNTKRLITILAPGGMGKTRLSLAVARTQIGKYDDGVFFVPLAPLSSPDDIVTTIAENIGFVFHGENPPARQLVNFLKDRDMLLVLDNFEHLLDGAGLVSDIIGSTSNLKIIVTSRERLNLRGETVYRLGGLEFPTWETPEDALEYDAVKLFVQSANQARADFELSHNDLDYLARICRLTAGMPLGIELAAGWVDVLSLEQIADEIQGGIDILETDMRDVPERHRSLRATFERTWERLTDVEQDVFMKLSVFRGGFTLDSAQAVASANARHLRKLAQKSLIQSEAGERYGIHELLRQFAEERLQVSGKFEAVRTQHATYFADLFAPLGDSQWSSYDETGYEYVRALNPDFENARTAWQFYVSTRNLDGLSDSLNGIWMFCEEDNRSQEGLELLEEVLDIFQPGDEDDVIILRSRVRVRIGWFLVDLGQRLNVIPIYEETLPILKQYNLVDDILILCFSLAATYWFTGNLESALDTNRFGYEILSKTEHPRLRKYIIRGQSYANYEMERYQEVVDWELSHAPKDQFPSLLGMSLYQLGRHSEAEPYLIAAEKSMLRAIQSQITHYYSIMHLYIQLIEINIVQNKLSEARAYFIEALTYVDTAIYWWVALEVLEIGLDILIADGLYQTAIEIISLIAQQSGDLGRIRNRALKRQPILQELVSPEVYEQAWERGMTRDINDLVEDLLSGLERN